MLRSSLLNVSFVYVIVVIIKGFQNDRFCCYILWFFNDSRLLSIQKFQAFQRINTTVRKDMVTANC